MGSNGLGDVTGPRVVDQLRAKHPARKEALPSSLEGYASFHRLTVGLAPTMRNFAKHARTGVSGFRNEYLIALTEDIANARAKQAIPLLESFAQK